MLIESPRKIPTHFSEVMRDIFHARALKNENYSLRAFARDLGLTSGNLSDILNRKTGLSLEKAKTLSEKLNLKPPDQQLFLKLVEIHGSKNDLAQNQILHFDSSYVTINDDYFRVLTDWFYFAVVELVRVQDFQNDDVWIAQRMGIPVSEVRPIIERLIRVKLLEEVGGELRQTYDFFVSPSGTASEAARNFHKQILQNAIEAIDIQNIESRDFTAGFLRVRKTELPAIAERIKKFRRELVADVESGANHDAIYAFSIQFFRGDRD